MHRFDSPDDDQLDDDKLHEECGVFGIFNHRDAAANTVLGLHALQHRGQEAAGIVSYNEGQFHAHRALGHVGDNFSKAETIAGLPGRSAIGHVRYSTTGSTVLRNVQPLFAEFAFGGLALCHNGNLTNCFHLRSNLVARGCIFQSTTDSEVIVHLIARSEKTSVRERIVDTLHQIEGAYSMVALTKEKLIGVRDPFGVRPLVLGRLGESYVLASETTALDIIDATWVRDIEPGEMVIIDKDGLESVRPFPTTASRFCIFEYIYFARPDSRMEGRSVYQVRKNIGAQLARESGIAADMVVPVPDSGVPAAIGYAEASGIPFELGIIRNHYVGRTFIEPTQSIRHFGVRLKHNANAAKLKGQRVVLVDDSIVRGTTSRKIVEMVRQAGVTEVHMRISSPPTAFSCYYGIDTPSRSELMAARLDVEAMRDEIGADSLAFLSLDGLYQAVDGCSRNGQRPQFCDACFSGDYPTPRSDIELGEVPEQLSLLYE